MREILFRGKRLNNGEWCYGSYLFLHISSGLDWRKRGKPEDVHYIVNDQGINYAVYPSTVGQYTGLKDKNGKRIFEGDIVKAQDEILGSPFCDGMNGKVVYDEAAYFIELKYPMNSQWLYDECAVYEVIGNIHDNPVITH